MKKPKHMLTGINLVDYGFDPDTFLPLVKRFKVGKNYGDVFNYISVRLDQKMPTIEQLYEWAQYFHDNEVYFKIVGNHPRVGELFSRLSKEEMAKIQEIGGEYFAGEGIGEFGGWYSSKAKGYESVKESANPVQGIKTCDEAVATYKRQIGKIIKLLRENGVKDILSTQAVTFFSLDFEAGIDEAIVEVAPRNMEQIMAFGRGAHKAHKKEALGAWLAHEFYGGYHQFDPLKEKRFTSEYYSLYLGGYDYVCLESGFREIHSHVDAMIPEGQPLPTSYLKEATDFANFCKSDVRPGNGPIVKVAFVQGNLDGFAYGNGSSLWGQYYDKKWGFAAPEFSYRILDEVYHSCEWNDGKNFGDYDYSGAPGYGQYDVIPANTPLDVLKNYEWVIFCGWNTMTPELLETYKQYVKEGGKLFITAAHLRDSVDRAEKGNFVPGLEEFLGVKLSGGVYNSNDGYKFVKYSTIDGMMYPGTKHLMCDPAWSAGYTDYVNIKETTATPTCFLSDTFGRPRISPEDAAKKTDITSTDAEMDSTEITDMSLIPVLTENKYGDGYVMFMANSEYPGAPEIFPLYKMVVKQILSASHRKAEVKVIGSDKLRFAVYEDEKNYKVYLFNSDFNIETKAIILYGDKRIEKVIDSVGIAIVEIEK